MYTPHSYELYVSCNDIQKDVPDIKSALTILLLIPMRPGVGMDNCLSINMHI